MTTLARLQLPSLATVASLPTTSRQWSNAARRWALWGLALGAAAGAAGLGVHVAGARGVVAVQYETTKVDRGRVEARVTATGTTSPLVTVQVGSQVSGRIDSLLVDFNSNVTKGEIVATLEPSLFRAAEAQARANWASAKANLDKARAQRQQANRDDARARALFAEGLVSRADLDTAEANASVGQASVAAAAAAVSQAVAMLEQAQLNLAYATIVSPIDGVVISRNVDVGQTVAAALQAPTLFTIAQDLEQMQVDTNVAEADIGKVREGMKASFTVDAYPGRTFAGAVRQVRAAPTTVQNVVTYDAVIDVDNHELLLKPGMTANASFVYAERPDVLRVGNAALRFKPDPVVVAAMIPKTKGAPAVKAPEVRTLGAEQRVVWVVRGAGAEPHVVTIGVSDGTTTEVVSGGLAVGDAAITEAAVTGKAKRP